MRPYQKPSGLRAVDYVAPDGSRRRVSTPARLSPVLIWPSCRKGFSSKRGNHIPELSSGRSHNHRVVRRPADDHSGLRQLRFRPLCLPPKQRDDARVGQLCDQGRRRSEAHAQFGGIRLSRSGPCREEYPQAQGGGAEPACPDTISCISSS